MSQYTLGLASVTNGSNQVVGNVDVDWTDVVAGEIFTVAGSNVWYEIASVVYSTGAWRITLSSNYGGTTAASQNYVIHNSFTPVYGVPYPEQGDTQTASLFKRAMLKVEDRIFAASLTANTRRSFAVVVTEATGDAYGIEQVSAAQTGGAPALRVFTSSQSSAEIVLGKYTSSTAFTSYLQISPTKATFSVGAVSALNNSGESIIDVRTNPATAGSRASPLYSTIQFRGYDGVGSGPGTLKAAIRMADQASNTVATVLSFWTLDQSSVFAERARFGETGNFVVGTTSDTGQKLQVNGTGIVLSDFSVGGLLNVGVNAIRTDVANRVIIGHTAAIQGHKLEIVSDTGGGFGNFRFTNDASGPVSEFRKSRTATNGANVIVQSGDSLGSILWAGANGTTYTNAAQIEAVVDGTPGASNDMPGRLDFKVTPDGSGTLVTRMSLSSSALSVANTIATTASANGAVQYSAVAPSLPTIGQRIGAYQIGTAADAGKVGFHGWSLENWVAGVSTGTYATIEVTPAGSTSRQSVAEFTWSNGQKLKGTASADDAVAGYIGEHIIGTVGSGSAIALTTTVRANVTSIVLTAGDWDVAGYIGFNPNAATVVSYHEGSISSISAGFGGESFASAEHVNTTGKYRYMSLPSVRISTASTVTLYLVARSDFTTNTQAAFGQLRARRVR